MRLAIVTLFTIAALAFAARPASVASAAHAHPTTTLATAAAQQRQPVDDNDDTRVAVMLVVLGIALFVVLGLGIAGYVVRRILGRVAPPPDQEATGHH